ncbi:hypothetical protein V6O07_18660, partial [Arthrospira platensis SPKY2]
MYAALAEKSIEMGDAEVAALPLAAVAAGQPLPLCEGVNPAWTGAIARLHDTVIRPLLGARDSLTESDWQALAGKLGAYHAWMADRPSTAVQDLDAAHLTEICGDDTRVR